MQFCGKCGAKLERICSQCSSSNPSEFRFCGKCGHDLKGPLDDSPVDYSRPQSYTPRFLADKILTTRSTIEGERKLVTVMFADVANFTSISEKLDPEDVHQIMEGCFKILMDQVHQNAGTINQFTGDGVMALFGAPLALEDHARQACRAALAIQSAMASYGVRLESKRPLELKMRIGLNSGPVIVGSIGDDLRMDYTAVGDTTNLASRMEGMAEPGKIYMSQNTHRLARDFFEFNSLGKVKIKGKRDTQEVFELISTGEVQTRIGASVAKGLTGFVGRKKSIATLFDAYKKARSGSGQIVGIVADAGVGKSRLILEFRNRLPQDDFAYFEGQCLQFGSTMAYLPILDILRLYFKIKEGDEESLIKKNMKEKIQRLDEKLHGILPPFHELLSLEINDDTYQKLEPVQKREKTFEAIRDLFVYESQARPVILVVEDLHWIDKTSEEFLDYLIGWLANARILLILLYRPEYTHPWGSKSYYNRVGLDQLTQKSSVAMISSILQGGEAAPELEELILGRAAGNPLFLEEFTRTLLENGFIRCEDRKCVLMKDVSEIQVPDTIEGIISARMDRLEDDIKRTMQVASVIGRDFAFRILERITEMKEGLKSYLLDLQGLEFIYEKSLFPELEYIFKHALTQEVAYNSLLQKKRKVIHEEIGRAIEEIWPDRVEEFYEMLAYHYSKSENAEKACHYLKLSGQKAMRSNSAWEALDYFNQAFHILDRLAKNTEQKSRKLETLFLSISPSIILGFPDDSLSLMEEGERLAKELEDDRKLFRFRTNIGFYYCTMGNYLDARPYIEKAFDAAEKLNDIDLMGQVIPDLYMVNVVAGEHLKIVNVLSDFILILEKSGRQKDFFGGPTNVYAILHALYGLSLGWVGNFEKALASGEKGILEAAAVKDARTLGMCHYFLGMILEFKGELEPAIERFHASIEYNAKLTHTPTLPGSYSHLGLAFALSGDSTTGCEYAAKGLKIQLETNYNYVGSTGWLYLGICLAESGALEAAQEHLEKGLEICREKNERVTEGTVLIWLGRVLGKRPSPEITGAEKAILSGIEISEALSQHPDQAVGYFFLGEFYAMRDQSDQAKLYLTKSLTMFEEMGISYWLAQAKKTLSNI